MNVLIVTDTFSPDINGVARTLETLARGLAARGNKVEVITTTDGAQMENVLHGVAVRRVRCLSLPGYREVRAGLVGARWFRQLMEFSRPDVIYVAVETLMGLNAIRAARTYGVPVVSGFHTNFHSYADNYHLPFMKPLAARFMRYFHNRTSRTLTPSHSTAAQLREIGVNNVGVLGRGVRTDLFKPAKRDATLRAQWGVTDDAPVALFVGRVAAEKN
ncbi:MAG: glycosyltransferase, partial [Verrucomicrobiaceae bacterium]